MKRLIFWIKRILLMHDRYGIPRYIDSLVDSIRPLVIEHDYLSTSGEHKRHLIYARAQKMFPATPKRDIALAIELSLRF